MPSPSPLPSPLFSPAEQDQLRQLHEALVQKRRYYEDLFDTQLAERKKNVGKEGRIRGDQVDVLALHELRAFAIAVGELAENRPPTMWEDNEYKDSGRAAYTRLFAFHLPFLKRQGLARQFRIGHELQAFEEIVGPERIQALNEASYYLLGCDPAYSGSNRWQLPPLDTLLQGGTDYRAQQEARQQATMAWHARIEEVSEKLAGLSPDTYPHLTPEQGQQLLEAAWTLASAASQPNYTYSGIGYNLDWVISAVVNMVDGIPMNQWEFQPPFRATIVQATISQGYFGFEKGFVSSEDWFFPDQFETLDRVLRESGSYDRFRENRPGQTPDNPLDYPNHIVARNYRRLMEQAEERNQAEIEKLLGQDAEQETGIDAQEKKKKHGGTGSEKAKNGGRGWSLNTLFGRSGDDAPEAGSDGKRKNDHSRLEEGYGEHHGYSDDDGGKRKRHFNIFRGGGGRDGRS